MYIQRLPFLPSSTSALMAVFLARRTFGFRLFPVFIVLIVPFFILLIFSYFLLFIVIILFIIFLFFEDFGCYFLFILFFFLIFGLFRGLLVSAALLDDCPGLLTLFVVSSGSFIPHLQALVFVSPIPVFPFYYFPCFYC